MILQGHASTPDELELVTGTAADVDVLVTYVTSDDPASATTMKPTVVHTLITTAATTVIATGPAANKVHGIKTLNIRNRDSTDTTQVTVQIDRNSVGTDVVQLHSFTLAPGEAMEWSDELGWYELAASPATQVGTNFASSASAAGFATDTYVSGSALPLTGLGAIRIGRAYHWRFVVSKTAAGTATPIVTVRVGTAGTTSDTARLTFTWGAGTAAVDRGEIELDCLFTAIGASAVLRGKANWTTNLTTTGLSNAVKALQVTSSTFDATVANSIIGLSYNGGTSASHTIEYVSAYTDNF